MEGFVMDPALRDLILWLMDSVNALLNYVPIFLILFAYIAFLEDLGYMPRMAFLLDAFFRRFGLHGQSTLPLVLGGVYVGGCAVPGVMACRAVPDERARLATILVVPMMNCLAKVPLYVLLIGIYFAAHKGPAMFFIATITILMALTTAKLLNLTVLREKESAPFIMEMPPYHAPTASAVLRRAADRVWMYVRKITTVVAAVAVVLFALMRFPGIPAETMADLESEAARAQSRFLRAADRSGFGDTLGDASSIDAFFDFAERYRKNRSGIRNPARAEAVDARFEAENPAFLAILRPRGNPEATRLSREYRTLRRARLKLRKEARDATLHESFLGRAGRWMEPATRYAGFNWRVNIALLSALAAKENTVATLGAMGIDCLVLRHPETGRLHRLASELHSPVRLLNAGDGQGEHPSQALLDAATLAARGLDWSSLAVAIIGDIRHSRVARSGLKLFHRLGVADLRIAGPDEMLPRDFSFDGMATCTSLEEAVHNADVIMMLRVQRERMDRAGWPEPEQYHRRWGLNETHLELARPDCLVMHPGPINRGMEINAAVADGPHSLILDQVRMGVFTRMAIFEWMLN